MAAREPASPDHRKRWSIPISVRSVVDGAAGDEVAFGGTLERLVAEAAAAEAVRERVHERTLRTVAEAEATFLGVAVDLAEAGVPVVVRTVGGRSHRGRVLAVGRDFLVLRDEARPPVLLAVASVTSMRPDPAGPVAGRDAAGGRPAPLDVSLAALLSRLGAERPRVQVVAGGDDPLTGELRSTGTDVVTLRLDGDRRPVVHVRLGAVHEVGLLDL